MRYLFALLLLASVPALAKPMMEPTWEEAMASDSIVEAEFLGAPEAPRDVEYFEGIGVRYKILRSFKGQLLPNRQITVNYAFHDGSACIAPPTFHFSPKMLPAKGSHWILFLQPGKGLWLTYRGEFGRKPSTPELVAKVSKKS